METCYSLPRIGGGAHKGWRFWKKLFKSRNKTFYMSSGEFGKGWCAAFETVVKKKETVIAEIKLKDKNGNAVFGYKIFQNTKDFSEQNEKEAAKKEGYEFQDVKFFKLSSEKI